MIGGCAGAACMLIFLTSALACCMRLRNAQTEGSAWRALAQRADRRTTVLLSVEEFEARVFFFARTVKRVVRSMVRRSGWHPVAASRPDWRPDRYKVVNIPVKVVYLPLLIVCARSLDTGKLGIPVNFTHWATCTDLSSENANTERDTE